MLYFAGRGQAGAMTVESYEREMDAASGMAVSGEIAGAEYAALIMLRSGVGPLRPCRPCPYPRHGQG
jgi:hypothetical protein